MARLKFIVCIVLVFYLISFVSPVSLVFTDNATANRADTALNDYYVTPKYGDHTTLFTYYAVFNYSYTYPYFVQVEIDGKYRYNMTHASGSNQDEFTFKYSTKLDYGVHNFTIVFNDSYSNWTKEEKTNVTWGPYVERNYVDLNLTGFNTTEQNCKLIVDNALINASVDGDLIGSVNFTDLEIIEVNTTSFDGKGFATANWSATIETKPYTGTWHGMMYYKPGEGRYYLKGTVSGDMKGITEGYLSSSPSSPGTFDVYNSTWTICRLGNHDIYANLNLNGTVDHLKTTIYSSSIYILQGSYQGNASGYYNGSLNVVLTHVRISKISDQYYGQGFSYISYSTKNASGEGWTYDYNSSTPVTTLHGYFTYPFKGIVHGKLNETGKNKTLSICIERLDYGVKPKPKLHFYLWGPGRVSPGQTVTYTVKYYNYGLKGAYGVELEFRLATNTKVVYISNTGSGTYNSTDHNVIWVKDIPPKSSGQVTVKCKVKWGVAQNTILNFYLYVNVTESTLIKHHKSLVTTARDPNVKYGPEGTVYPGQKLSYKVEYENIGKGIAYGVYVTDTLSEYLDDSTLAIGPVKSTLDNSIIAPAGTYNQDTRTITWLAGEVGPSEGGYANITINVKNDAPHQAAIINYATVYFPSVPEETLTNSIVSSVKINKGPVANVGGNKVVKTLEDVTFDASQSTDSDGSIIKYTWDLGDGSIDDGESVVHQYLDDGIYTVKLTVEDNDGFTDAQSINVNVQNRAPEAKMGTSTTSVDTLVDVNFDASGSSDLDGSISKYYIDFGDGTNSGWMQTSTITHQYSVGGDAYTASLKVKDDDGDVSTNTAEVEITVQNRKPAAKLMVEPMEALTYEDIEVGAGQSADADGTLSQYYFDFGDGTDSGWVTSSSVKHQYTDGTKNYVISLKVKDNQGLVSDNDANIEILIKNRKPSVALAAEPVEAYTYTDISFDASGSADMDGILQYLFDYGDGTDSGWLGLPTSKHQYKDGPGEYTVKLLVKDDDGETGTVELVITIYNRLPDANAGPDQTVADGSEVTFLGLDSGDIDGEILLYDWDFGDGSGASGASVAHTYADDGTYTVTLTATDDDGGKGTDQCIITVLNNRPTVDFTVNMYTGTVETLFEFQSSAYDMDGTVANLAWDFGDSETSTETDPDHQYDKHGTYTVTLIAEDDDGAKSAEISKIITVLNSKPIAKISAMPQTVFVGDELEFDGSGSSDADGESLTYTWDLGDGSSGTGKTTKHVYPEKGTYLVTLTVTDESGNEASASVEIVIKDKSTIEGQTTKSELTSGLAIAAVIAIILIMIVLFAVSMRKRKTAEGESDLEEE